MERCARFPYSHPSRRSVMINIVRTPIHIANPLKRILLTKGGVRILCFGSRGGICIFFASPVHAAIESAGSTSVARLIQRISTAVRTFGIKNDRDATTTTTTSPVFDENMYHINFRIF